MLVIFLILNLSQIADFYFNLGDIDLACRYYRASMKIEGEDPEVILRFGQTCHLLGRYPEAVEALSQLDSEDAHRWLGFTYFQSGHYQKAVKILKDVSQDPVTSYYYAVALYQVGDYQNSLDVFNKLTGISSDEIQFWKSLILARMGNQKEALKHLDRMTTTGWWADIARYLDSYLRDQLAQPLIYNSGNRILFLRARKAFYDGQIRRAKDIIDSVSGFSDYRSIGLALCYLKLNWNHKAIRVLNSLPDTGWIENYVHRLLGEAHLNLKNYKSARAHFRAIGILGLDGLIMTFFKTGAYDSVVYYIERLEVDRPECYDDHIRFLKAQSLFNLKRYHSVRPICREIINSDPETNFAQQAYILIGEANLADAKPDSAREVWFEFVNSHPASPLAGLAMKRIGDSYYKTKDYKNAINTYDKIKDFPHTTSIMDDADFKTEIARYRIGIYHSYITALINYLRRYPESPRAPKISLEIGDRYRNARRMTKALRWYEKSIESYPAIKLQGLLRIVKIKEIINDLDGLKETYRSIIDIDNNPGAIQQLARLYKSVENYDSAIVWFERLSHVEKYHLLAYYELAKINRKIDRIKEAEFFLRPIVESDSPYKRDAILELAEILRETGRFDEAKRILAKISNNPNSHLILGEIEFFSGNYLEAKTQFIRACSLFGEDRNACAEALIQAGDAALKAGDKEAASKLLERAELLASDPRIKIRAKKKREGIE